jgi:hypothetical protein
MAARKSPKKPRPASGLPREAIEIDFVILGDYAQAVQGKLNLIGGGWNTHNTDQYPSALPFGIGIGILVPWSLTNRTHRFELVIKGSEGADLVRGGGEFEVGRGAGIPAGMTQRFTLGISGQLQVPEPGTYEIIVTSADSIKRVTFEALPVRRR